MKIHPNEAILCLIDYQEKLMPAIHGHDQVLQNALRLASAAKALHIPTVATEQNPNKLGGNVGAIGAMCDTTIRKMHFSACEDGLLECLEGWMQPSTASTAQDPRGNARSLPKHLRKAPAPPTPQRSSIVIAGCEAHICLLQTALDLLEEELEVWVVTDACGSRTAENRDAAFDRLASNGAELVTTEMVLYEWVQSCEHPLFKDILALVK